MSHRDSPAFNLRRCNFARSLSVFLLLLLLSGGEKFVDLAQCAPNARNTPFACQDARGIDYLLARAYIIQTHILTLLLARALRGGSNASPVMRHCITVSENIYIN